MERRLQVALPPLVTDDQSMDAMDIIVGTHHKAGHTAISQLWVDLGSAEPTLFDVRLGLCTSSVCVNSSRAASVEAEEEGGPSRRAVCVQMELSARNTPWILPRIFVQPIRDPLAMLVSAFQYHLTLSNTTSGNHAEPWAQTPMAQPFLTCRSQAATFDELVRAASWRGLPGVEHMTYAQYLHTLDVAEGLRVEFAHMSGWALGDMVAMYERAQHRERQQQQLRAAVPSTAAEGSHRHGRLHVPVRLEDLESGYEAAVEVMLRSVGLRGATLARCVRAAVERRSSAGRRRSASEHATDKQAKASLRVAVARDRLLCPQVARLQRRLGYDEMRCFDEPRATPRCGNRCRARRREARDPWHGDDELYRAWLSGRSLLASDFES